MFITITCNFSDVEKTASPALSKSVTVALRDLFDTMEQGSTIPFTLLQVLHSAFPRFAEKSEQGGFQQQVQFKPISKRDNIASRAYNPIR